MRLIKSVISMWVIALIITTNVHGQNQPNSSQPSTSVPPKTAKSASPSAGLVNDWLREQSSTFEPWNIGGQERIRFEHKEFFAGAGGEDFRNTGGNSDNTYFLNRTKVHLGYTPFSYLTGYVEARDSNSFDDDRNPSPDDDTFDLHQAYIQWGDTHHHPLQFKIGRQELLYGDQRLIGPLDWTNTGRVFDAAKLRLEVEGFWVEAFISEVVVVDDNNLNERNHDDIFSGIYLSTTEMFPKFESQLYILSRNTRLGSATSPRDVVTIGSRIKSKPGQFGRWDFSGEFAGQFGNFNIGGQRLSHEAYALFLGGGYTWSDTKFTPQLGLEYNFASGDSSSTDSDHNTFDNLFPTNHKFYGYMDFVSLQNIHNVVVKASLKPMKKLKITADWHLFWLADTGDFFYRVNGAPRTTGGYGITTGAGSYVGSEIDIVATYAIRPDLKAQIGYGHFFVGDYVENTLALAGATDTDADYVYVQTIFNF